jgi:Mg-chelatase subunit ChlD
LRKKDSQGQIKSRVKTMENFSMLEQRDYTLIIDKSGSMATPDQKGGRTRWFSAQESTLALASKCEQFDPDGITVYVFSGRFKRYENVTSAKVSQIFRENDPSGTTDLAGVLKHATNDYFQRKASGQVKQNGELVLVITDGEPDDRKAVMKVIIEASRRMDRDEELGISFIQVGTDPQATRFLKVLDDELQNAGAKFDICDTVTMDDMEDMSLAEVLMNAIND